MAFVALHAQVLGGLAFGEPVEPHGLALRRVDQRPVLPRARAVGREDVARARVPIGARDAQDRYLGAREGRKALVVRGGCLGVGERGNARRGIGRVDEKPESHLRFGVLTGRCSRRKDGSAHAHPLPGLEGGLRDEAGPVALRVGGQAARVGAAAGAAYRDSQNMGGRHAEEADLGGGIGGGGFRRGRHLQRGAREPCVVLQSARQAGGRGRLRAVFARARQGAGREQDEDRGDGQQGRGEEDASSAHARAPIATERASVTAGRISPTSVGVWPTKPTRTAAPPSPRHASPATHPGRRRSRARGTSRGR